MTREEIIQGLYRGDSKAIKEAIKILEREPDEDAISRSDAVRVASGYCHPANIAKELAKLPPVTPKKRWISVSERLPKEGEEVLVSGYDTYHKKVVVAKYQGEKYGFTCGLVPAWMPLPKPYEPQAEYKDVHCNCTDEEIAKSFISDVETVKDLLPQAESEDNE